MITKIKKMSKKVMAVVVGTMLAIASLTASVYALDGTTSSIVYPEWKMADPVTEQTDGVEGYLFVDNEPVYCVDYHTSFHSGKKVTQGSFADIGISEETAKRLSVIAYYGTKVPGRTGRDWYAITQGLLWRVIHNDNTLKYIRTNTTPNFETTQKAWNQIMADVDRYYTAPSFANSTQNVDSDGTLQLMDKNGVLSDMVISDAGGLDVSIKGNQLVINGNSNTSDEVTIALKKNIPVSEMGTSLVYTAPDCQAVASFRINNTMEAKLKIKINRFGKLELTKYNDDKSSAISQTTYRITGPNGFDEMHTTNEDGKIILNRLAIGEYKAIELQAGSGYLIDTTEFGFTIKADETTAINPINLEPKGKIILTKVIDSSQSNSLTGDAYLKGNSYGLFAKEDIKNKAETKTYYYKDELIAKKETDEEGRLTWDDLYLGQYYIRELKSNDSLVLNQGEINVSLEYQGQTVSKVILQKETSNKINKQKIRVFKSGEKAGMSGFVKGLQGAEFTFKLKSEVNHAGWDNAQTYAVITTDKDGYATTGYLPYGTYMVKETKTPQDYITAPDFIISVTCDYSEYVDVEQIKTVNINNRPFTSQVKLVKKDKDTNQTVTFNSASFKIKDEDGNYVTQKVSGQNIDTFTTNSKNQITALFGNKGEVTLPLQLDAGTYTVEEIKVPEGFLELDEPLIFTITNQYDYDIDEDNDPILEVVVKNAQPKGRIIISKTDKETGVALTDVEYELIAKEDIINATDGSILYKAGQIVDSGVTNKDGQIIIDNLFMGYYELKETLTNEGYVLSTKVHDIALIPKDTSTKLYVVDVNATNQKTKVEISKKDVTTGNELEGAQLTLFNKNNQAVETWISTNEPHIIKGLLVGEKYRLHEDFAPLGYVKACDITFTVNNTTEVQRVEMTDDIIKVEISKQDIVTGKELSGAKLQIIDENSKVIHEWITADKPHLFEKLPAGQYTLKETAAPDGYEIAEDIAFTVEETGSIQKIIMKDKPVKKVVVKTGDNTIIGLYACGMAIAGLGWIYFIKKKKNQDKGESHDK